jgi:hypothetical protein
MRVGSTIGGSGLALALLATGCWGSYWGRRPVDQPTPVQPDEPVWIWSSDGVEEWHAVVITQYHVSGIPYHMSVHCDSCWRAIPRTRVDSMKIGYHTFAESASDVVRTTTLFILAELTAGLVVHSLR